MAAGSHSSPKTADASMPDGWTDNKNELHIEALWGDTDGNGNLMAAEYGLASPTPIMCSTRRSGDAMYIVESGGKFYLWSQINDEVFELEGVQSKEEIVQTIQKGGAGRLPTKRL
ncbi:hypothetical protein BBP40_002375 [Aspergillus hancockii]|nr:hypothetical protein BBP40_002375 [Aspergillus hancockii]